MDEENELQKPTLSPKLPRWWRILPFLVTIIIITNIDSLMLNDFIEYRYTIKYRGNATSKASTRDVCLNSTESMDKPSRSISTTTTPHTPISTTESPTDLIQEATARLNVFISLSATLPAIFTSIVLGSNSDRVGRRPLIILPFLGKIFRYTILSLVAYLDLADYWIIIAVVIDGLCGTSGLSILSAFAFVSDCTNKNNRTKAIVITDVCIASTKFLPLMTLGLYLENSNFTPALLFTLGLAVVGFILATIFQPESTLDIQHLNIFQQLARAKFSQTTKIFQVFLAKRAGHNQRNLLLLIGAHLSLIVMTYGSSAVQYLYLYGTPFCFDSFGVSLVTTTITAISVLFTTIYTCAVPKHSDNLFLPMLGLSFHIAQITIYAVANTVWMIYMGASIGALYHVFSPVIRARITKLVEPTEYATVFILTLIFESGGNYAINALSNEIYKATLTIYSGIVYFAFSTFGILGIVFLL